MADQTGQVNSEKRKTNSEKGEVKSGIPDGWKMTTLGEVAGVQTGPFGSQLHNEDYVKDGSPIITVENLVNDYIEYTEDTPQVSDGDKNRLKKYTLKKGDIVFSRVGSVDRCGFVSEKEDGWLFSGRLLRVRPKSELFDRYGFYWVSQDAIKEYVRKVAVGATMPSINTSLLSQVPITIPPLPEQRAIAAVLSSLDDKIGLLREQNKTLEATAQTIFKEWFVNFNFPNENGKPYKDSGGKMIDSELGPIPEGWRVGKLGEIGQIICGKTPPKENQKYFGGEIPFIKIPDMHGEIFIVETEDSLTELGANSQKNKLIPKDTICVSCIATVGLVSITSTGSQTNQQINSIIPNDEKYLEYLYFMLTSMKNDLLAIGSGGSATLNINTSTFANIETVFSADEILKTFHNTAKPIFTKILGNLLQIQTLSKIRNTLLPKLMKGEVRIKGFSD